jgi:hypothetical protein
LGAGAVNEGLGWRQKHGVMAGLVPAIPMLLAKLCHRNRDHRVPVLRAGPVMTAV